MKESIDFSTSEGKWGKMGTTFFVLCAHRQIEKASIYHMVFAFLPLNLV